MSKTIIILIDGGFLRVKARHAGKTYDPVFIEIRSPMQGIRRRDTTHPLLRLCSIQRHGQAPVSGTPFTFPGSDKWMDELARKDLFAVCRGVLKFRGYKPKHTPVNVSATLTDADFEADFEQKGVDMRIGLDIASYSANRAADRIVLVSNDTDCVPAMKYGRKAGLQIVLVELPNNKCAPELVMHADYKRAVP